jgi:hypothetical protein
VNAEFFALEVNSFWDNIDLELKKNCDGVLIDWDLIPRKHNNIILGQYIIKPPFKPKIVLYFKSFLKVYGNDDNFLIEKISEVIRHELVHHVEYLNGTNTMAKNEVSTHSHNNLKSVLILISVCIILVTVLYYIFT